MPSRAWVVTLLASCLMDLLLLFQCPHGLELLRLHKTRISFLKEFQCPHGLELLLIMDGMPVQRIRFNALSGLSCYKAQESIRSFRCVSMPSRAWVVTTFKSWMPHSMSVSMPSRAWVVTYNPIGIPTPNYLFQCPLGLELLRQECPIF